MKKLKEREWNYFMCNQCYVMFPHLAVPEVCVCGNDMLVNSTRKKFILSFHIREFVENIKTIWSKNKSEDFCCELNNLVGLGF